MGKRRIQGKDFVSVATKVPMNVFNKLEIMCSHLGIDSKYQLMQQLILALLKAFDSYSSISEEHEVLVRSFLTEMATQKGSFSPIQIKGIDLCKAAKAIFFVNRKKGERPQMICVSIDEKGNVNESYNTNTILIEVLSSLDPEMLNVLKDEQQSSGCTSVIDALRNIIDTNRPPEQRLHSEIDELFSEEVAELFADFTVETFEEITDVHYRRKHSKGIDGVKSFIPEADKPDWNKHLKDKR